jgi:hypothetical protein
MFITVIEYAEPIWSIEHRPRINEPDNATPTTKLYAVLILLRSVNYYLKSTIFWDITPCSPLKVNRRFGGTSRSSSDSTLKMEAICFSEMLVDFQQTTRRYIPEDSIHHNHRCENLKSYILFESYEIQSVVNLHLNNAYTERSLHTYEMLVLLCVGHNAATSIWANKPLLDLTTAPQLCVCFASC